MQEPGFNPWAAAATPPAASTNVDDWGDVDSFGADAKPGYVMATTIESLPDGHHDFEVLDARSELTRNNNRILKVNLKVQGGGSVEWPIFLSDQNRINALLADLLALGFDADKWGPQFNRPLSAELPKATAKLKGIKFRAHKTSRRGYCDAHKANNCQICGPNAGRMFHDLRVLCRIDGRPMPPLTPPAQTPAPHPQQPPGMASAFGQNPIPTGFDRVNPLDPNCPF